MKNETTSRYKFVCWTCGKEKSVNVDGLWRSRTAVKPKGWECRVVNLFYRSFCPSCK